MCGRFTLGKKPDEIIDYFKSHFNSTVSATNLSKYTFKFNIPPSSDILTIRYNSDKQIECHAIRWGLVPSWSKGIDNRFSMNNARSDTISSKPAFRLPFKQQRCLILADGFYEWQNQTEAKQPYYISRQDRRIFTFAGIWDQWISPDQSSSVQSCSIITTEASSFMTKIHPRMPVIIAEQQQHEWLSQSHASDYSTVLLSLLTQSDYSQMQYYAVSKKVNSPRNDLEELITKIN